MSTDPRLDSLEATAQRLQSELAALRRSIAELRESPSSLGGSAATPALSNDSDQGSSVPQTPPPARTWAEVMDRLGAPQPAGVAAQSAAAAPRPEVANVSSGRGLEDLIGRYGTIGLAALTILMGVGALLGWAIRNGYVGPRARITIGLVIAGALAGIGWRIRRGDSPRYGNALLALSLAVVHVVAWGAGPRLGLVSAPVVLGLAALASGALAGLAWREGDQSLFTVGFGGALLAPFVTSSGGGNAVLLMAYGFVVLMAGIAALGQREWVKVPWMVALGIAWYAAFAESMVDGSQRWAVANAPAAFALGLGALSIVLLEGAKRAAVVWPALLTALGVLVAVADSPADDRPQFVFAVALVMAAIAAGERSHRGVRTAVVGALILPAGGTMVALGTLTDVTSWPGALVALGFAGITAWASWRDMAGERGTWAFTATALVGLAIALASQEQRVAFCVATAVFGVASAAMTRRWEQSGIGLAGALWMTAATVVAFGMLDERVAYEYSPFLTQASVAAAVVSGAWILLSWHTARTLAPGSALGQDLPRAVIRMAGWVVAFLWVRQELAEAFSPDVSGFLLVAWYAVSGVASIFVGRSRALPMLRQVGLGLALFAALTALAQATGLAIGWRVASYMLTGVFLLGVAWSYRVTREVTPPPSPQG